MNTFQRASATSVIALLGFAYFSCPGLSIPAYASVESGETAVSVEPASPKQGQTLILSVTSASAPPAVTFNGKTYKLFPRATEGDAPSEYRALIGVPANLKPGGYSLKIGDESRQVQVKAGNFPIQSIRLPKSKDNFISSPGEEETVQQAKETVSPVQHWTGKFKAPSKARTSSAFGLRRKVNGRLLADYFHSGLDYAGGWGSPVTATQGGRVIIAKNGWRLHGNTIAIDHGQGVVSFYIHLSKLLVKQGELVKAGQEIGKIGATGRASGPHLHFSIYVNGNATNPADFYTRNL